MAWLRDRGVEPDPSGTLGLVARSDIADEQLVKALEEHTEADLAVIFLDLPKTPESLAFWEQGANRERRRSSTRHEGSLEELQARGFDVDVDPNSRQVTDIRVGAPWLKERNCEIIGKSGAVFLLRNAAAP